MFRQIFFSFLSLLFFPACYAQYYRGKVTDENGKPLPGTNIYIPGGFCKGTISFQDGSFGIDAKPYQTLEFYYTGRQTYSLQLTPKDTTDICIVMKPKTVRLDEVTVRKTTVIKEYVDCVYEDDRYIFQLVVEDAKFPGGPDSLKSYLHHSLQYPEQAFINGEEGQVWVEFTVDSKGKAVRPQIRRSVSPALDAEAVRLIQNMPTWHPGSNRSKKVDSRFLLPINFYIHLDYQQIIEEE